MRKVYLFMAMSLDGFFSGTNGELDWLTTVPDKELNNDTIALLDRADAGFMGYPAASGMIPYWASVPNNPSTLKSEVELAQAINKIHSIVISNVEEKLEYKNAELFLVKDDRDLIEGVAKFKRQPGRDIGVPGGIRTAQKFTRLGLIDEYIIMVHPVAIGEGKRVFTTQTKLYLVGSKAYKSGVVQLIYRPR